MEAEAFQFCMDADKRCTKALEFSGVWQVKWKESPHSLVTPFMLLQSCSSLGFTCLWQVQQGDHGLDIILLLI